jgi:hypothetical protein
VTGVARPQSAAELVKRIVVSDTVTKQSVLQNMGATALVNGTRHGYGKSTPKERQQKEVTILDIFGNAASAKAVMGTGSIICSWPRLTAAG